MELADANILFVCMQYDYGQSERGSSYEWNHFYQGTRGRFRNVEFFDFLGLHQAVGREEMNAALLEQVRQQDPDIVVFALYRDELDTACLSEIRGHARTLAFFHDDSWRRGYVRQWAPHFDAFTTALPDGEESYREVGLDHAVYFPFGVNERSFCMPDDGVRDIPVSFIGAWHPHREWLLSYLANRDIDVTIYGYRWPRGMIDLSGMIDVFQRSQISLNLSNCVSWDPRYLLTSPRGLINTLRSGKNREQIKGRHFEIPACGAMQISYDLEGLDGLFIIGEEIEVFSSPAELADKIGLYLADDRRRERMAMAGQDRVQAEHTYYGRFRAVFEKLGWLEL